MMRIIFYLLVLGALLGGTAVVLFVNDFSGVETARHFVNGVINGSFRFGTTAGHFYYYGLMLFLILNAATLLTLLLIFAFSKFRFRNIRRPYLISLWLIISTLILTGFWTWLYVDIRGWNFVFNDVMFAIIPLGTALIVGLVGLVFSSIERRRR